MSLGNYKSKNVSIIIFIMLNYDIKRNLLFYNDWNFTMILAIDVRFDNVKKRTIVKSITIGCFVIDITIVKLIHRLCCIKQIVYLRQTSSRYMSEEEV